MLKIEIKKLAKIAQTEVFIFYLIILNPFSANTLRKQIRKITLKGILFELKFKLQTRENHGSN